MFYLIRPYWFNITTFNKNLSFCLKYFYFHQNTSVGATNLESATKLEYLKV